MILSRLFRAIVLPMLSFMTFDNRHTNCIGVQVNDVQWLSGLNMLASCADDSDASLVLGEVCADDRRITRTMAIIRILS